MRKVIAFFTSPRKNGYTIPEAMLTQAFEAGKQLVD